METRLNELVMYSKSRWWVGGNALAVPIINLLSLSMTALPATMVAFKTTDAECGAPLSEWLMGITIVMLIQIFFNVAALPFGVIHYWKREDPPMLVSFVSTCNGCFSICCAMPFSIVWYILGSAWLWGYEHDPEKCPESLRTMILVLLVLFYATIGILLVAVGAIFAFLIGLGGLAKYLSMMTSPPSPALNRLNSEDLDEFVNESVIGEDDDLDETERVLTISEGTEASSGEEAVLG
eukprot:TRINITY_DN8594_c0_g1_i1.p1 TRINITY_DN8594_c0_g1~~TRINITY_DN8594_c0_g1_i1.p1  ORF type:complete len:237 (+),score=22.99 TRINITY_DN8594_c0_g1_i1:63-773(+)